jgi:hypothetical protein
VDAIKCFLVTFEEGKLAQQISRLWMAAQAKTFFFPRSLPTTIPITEPDEDSTISALSITLSDLSAPLIHSMDSLSESYQSVGEWSDLESVSELNIGINP